MKCPYCNKDVYGLTGLQELQKFQKHLRRCKKYQQRMEHGEDESEAAKSFNNKSTDFKTALELRAKSGQ